MPFYNELDNPSNFQISFKKNLRNDFGVFAKGYAKSVSKLAVDLLSRNRFGDYEAYPIVFLYRHSLELHLKNIIYRSVLLSTFKNIENIDHRLYNKHDLNLLSEKATQILLNLFPDYGLESFKSGSRLERVLRSGRFTITSKLNSPGVLRYPLNKLSKQRRIYAILTAKLRARGQILWR